MVVKNEMKVYKIRDKESGLFSTGGVCPSWTKSGKAWGSRGALKNHLTQYCNPGIYDYETRSNVKRQIPDSWEVVEFTFKLSESQTFSARVESERVSKK